MSTRHRTIGELGRETGTKAETIRFYERIGLLSKPQRTAANYRLYSSDDRNRLRFIRRSRSLGFSLDQIRTMLDLSHDKHRSCSAIDGVAREHLSEIDRKIADLRKLRSELGSIINRCSRGTTAECRIVDALSAEMRPE